MALPFHKLLQTLNSGSSIGSAAVAILASYGTDAHIYLPGIGAFDGYTLGNWLDSGGTTPATVDNPVGLVQDAIGTIHASQGTTANKPILRKPSNNYYWEFDGVNDSLALSSMPFQQADDRCVIVGFNAGGTGLRGMYFVGDTTGWSFVMYLAVLAGGQVISYYRDDAHTLATVTGSSLRNGLDTVASARVVSGSRILRVNGVAEGGTNSTVLGATVLNLSSIGNNPAGATSAFLQGNIYPIIAIKGTISDANLLILERWVGSLTGPTGVVIP